MGVDLKDALLTMSSRIGYVSDAQKEAVERTIAEYFDEPPAPVVSGGGVSVGMTVSEVSDGG